MTSPFPLPPALLPIVRNRPSGVRIVGVEDPRSPVVEFEIGVSAAASAAPDGRALAALVVAHESWPSFVEELAESGGGVTVENRGEWMLLRGRVLPLDDQWGSALLDVLGGVRAQTDRHAAELAMLPHSDPIESAWLASRGAALAAGAPGYGVVVGPVDEQLLDRVADALDNTCATLAGTAQTIARPERALALPASTKALVWIGTSEPAGDAHGAERFLGTALLTSGPTSKLIQHLPNAPGSVEQLMVGRDVVAGRPRAFAVAQPETAAIDAFVEWISRTVGDGALWDVSESSFTALVDYCADNITESFESPRAVCEAVAEGLRRGASPTWLTDLLEELPRVSLTGAIAAADLVFSGLGEIVVAQAAPGSR